jgi:hypothetical protein
VLLRTHQGFVSSNTAEGLIELVERIPDKNSYEREQWEAHMGCLVDEWQRRTQEVTAEAVSWSDVSFIKSLID